MAATCPERRACVRTGGGARPPAPPLCRPAMPARRPRPIPAPLPFISALELGAGRAGAARPDSAAGFYLGHAERVRALVSVRPARPGCGGPGLRVPGPPPGRLGWAPLSHPRATRSCHLPGAGGSRATDVMVRFRGRSDRVRRAPLRSPPGPVWQVAFVVGQGESPRPRTPFQDPTVSPLRSASPLLTKERPPLLPLPRAPPNGRGAARVRAGFLRSNLRTSVPASHLFRFPLSCL